MDINYKQFTLEIKSLQEDGSFEGYVAAFGNIDFGDDIFEASAFNDEPTGKFYPLLADHDTRKPIGKFQIEIDNYGVKFKNAKFNLMRDETTGNYLVPNAAEKYANLKNGDISGFSVGYGVEDCEFKTIGEKRCRIITKAKLFEGSVVTFPMNDKARLTAIKSMLQNLDEAEKKEIKEILNPEKEDKDFSEITSLKDIETLLKMPNPDGFSCKDAKTVISKVKEFSRDEKEETKVDKRDAFSDSVSNLKSLLEKQELHKSITNLQSILTKK